MKFVRLFYHFVQIHYQLVNGREGKSSLWMNKYDLWMQMRESFETYIIYDKGTYVPGVYRSVRHDNLERLEPPFP